MGICILSAYNSYTNYIINNFNKCTTNVHCDKCINIILATLASTQNIETQ